MDPDLVPWHRDPETMGGMLVFKGTRVPVSCLLDNLAAGMSVPDFLYHYPTVRASQVTAAFESLNDLADEATLLPGQKPRRPKVDHALHAA